MFYLITGLGINEDGFIRGLVTTSNRNFFQLLINMLLIAVATNNIEYPSGVTQSYDNSQRVSVGGKLLDLQTAVTHNVQTFVKYYKQMWPDTKYERLLPKDPLDNVPMLLKKTFPVIDKYHCTSKKNVYRWIGRIGHASLT